MNTTERAIEALRRIADPKLTPSDGDPVVLREHARDALAALEAERAASAPAREALIQRLRERLRIVSLDTDTEQAILDAIDALATPGDPAGQWYQAPPAQYVGLVCPQRIGPEEKK